MKHMMLDCYCKDNMALDDAMAVYNFLNCVAYEAKLKPIAPPMLIPYYYCNDEDDVGISAYLFLDGGHITIHTFPRRQCYFADVLYDGNFDAERVYACFRKKLPFEEACSEYCLTDRRVTDNGKETIGRTDFGPHLVGRLIPRIELTLDSMFDLLEKLVSIIQMQPIARANVIKNNLGGGWLQGIVVIAQSHISMYYDKQNKRLYFDLFSCSFFDFSIVESLLEKYIGKPESLQLVKRGDKYALDHKEEEGVSLSEISKMWQRNIQD